MRSRHTLSRFAVCAACGATVAACGEPLGPYYQGGNFIETITSAGIERTYMVHVPASIKPGRYVPLLIAFHGAGQTANGLQQRSGLNGPGDREGVVVVYPSAYEGTGSTWAIDNNSFPDQFGTDDLQFVRDMLSAILREVRIDTTRIWVTGISNGALFAQRVACIMADKVAGLANVAANMFEHVADKCQPSRPVRTIFFHGTDDFFFPFEGAVTQFFRQLSSEQSVGIWAAHNGCDPDPVRAAVPDVADDYTTVEHRRFTGCPAGGEVHHFVVFGGGHNWPGSPDTGNYFLGCTTHDIAASELIFEFFLTGALSVPAAAPRLRALLHCHEDPVS